MSEGTSPQPTMTPERWHQIKDSLADAIRLPAEDRPRYIAKVCGDDSALRTELESLIAAHEIAERGAFDNPAFDITTSQISHSPTPDRLVGRQIGAVTHSAHTDQELWFTGL